MSQEFVTCQYCGMTALEWRDTARGSRLFEQNDRQHKCAGYLRNRHGTLIELGDAVKQLGISTDALKRHCDLDHIQSGRDARGVVWITEAGLRYARKMIVPKVKNGAYWAKRREEEKVVRTPPADHPTTRDFRGKGLCFGRRDSVGVPLLCPQCGCADVRCGGASDDGLRLGFVCMTNGCVFSVQIVLSGGRAYMMYEGETKTTNDAPVCIPDGASTGKGVY